MAPAASELCGKFTAADEHWEEHDWEGRPFPIPGYPKDPLAFFLCFYFFTILL